MQPEGNHKTAIAVVRPDIDKLDDDQCQSQQTNTFLEAKWLSAISLIMLFSSHLKF